MIYALKIAYTLLFPPGIIIVLLLSIALRLQQKREFIGSLLVGVAALVLCATSLPYIGNEFLQSIEQRYSPPKQFSGDVLIMLTGGATQDTPNPLTGGEGYLSPSTSARVLTTVELYRNTKLPIILSGGQVFSDTGNESQIAKRHLLALGVPDSAITLDDTSRNTKENAANAVTILNQKSWERPILVTSAFHMARAVKQFQKHKVNVIPYPTDFQTNRKQTIYFSKFIPSSSGLSTTTMALKEYLGLLGARK
ncbi:YdcF family protein [Paenibacillus sp. SYP-B3998]|uniref:YdcF family protein n=1 Tax=Paenibacillus sp. SYP-B3998 TaxID=2678564 RepID=A0A6G4A0G8_9BACL|nr:YdcF family protein [Paenibacillus sp. SYP-B3998]NEW07788.1 YdcF family protein [Paenibacillus sp. SYP-B3998]